MMPLRNFCELLVVPPWLASSEQKIKRGLARALLHGHKLLICLLSLYQTLYTLSSRMPALMLVLIFDKIDWVRETFFSMALPMFNQ